MLIHTGQGAGCLSRQPNNVPHDPTPTTARGKRRSRPRPDVNKRYAFTRNRRTHNVGDN